MFDLHGGSRPGGLPNWSCPGARGLPLRAAGWALRVTGRWPNLYLEQRETTPAVEAEQLKPCAGLSSRGALASHPPHCGGSCVANGALGNSEG